MIDDFLFKSNISEQVPQEEYEHMKLFFDSIDAISRLTNASMFVIDFAKREMVYRTENLVFIDEYTKQETIRKCINPYWALMTEKDFQIMHDIRAAYLRFVQGLNATQKMNHTCVIDYKIGMHNHECIVTQKFTPLKLRSNGNLWLGLFYVTISTHRACEHIVIYGKKNRYVYDFDKKAFLPFNRPFELTSMEKAILLRAAKGFTTEQIADDLCRSLNTIKTHKSRLFDKLHVNSMAEAITLVLNYNLS